MLLLVDHMERKQKNGFLLLNNIKVFLYTQSHNCIVYEAMNFRKITELSLEDHERVIDRFVWVDSRCPQGYEFVIMNSIMQIGVKLSNI